MGYVTAEEGRPWQAVARRAGARTAASSREGDRWFAAEATREPKAVLRGPARGAGPGRRATTRCSLRAARREGVVLRARASTGAQAWCDRRLLARIHRYTLDRLRKEIEPVTAAQFLRFLACWQHVDPRAPARRAARRGRGGRAARRLRGAGGGLGGERPARARARLQARVARPAHALGRGRLGPPVGRGPAAPSAARPICLVPREDLDSVVGAGRAPSPAPSRARRRGRDPRRAARRAARCSSRSCARATRLPAGRRRGRAWPS